jgi:hypothetical protein
MKQYIVDAPWERRAIDILGPLPRSEDGNRYLMVVEDYFTKWTEAIPKHQKIYIIIPISLMLINKN